ENLLRRLEVQSLSWPANSLLLPDVGTSKNRGSPAFPVGGAGGPDRMYRMIRRGHRPLPQGSLQGATVFRDSHVRVCTRWCSGYKALLPPDDFLRGCLSVLP